MFNSVKDQPSYAMPSHRRSVSAGKYYKSAASSPTTRKMVAKNQFSSGKGKGQAVNYFTQNVAQLKMSYYALKEDHLTFQNEIFTFMEGFKHILSEFGPDMGGSKSKSQMTSKVLQLVSELDSTKFEMKKRLEEKDEKIKEVQVRLREKDQEVCLVQTQLDIKKEEIKAKENTILRLEKSLNMIKQQHQQELNKFENDRSSLENRYLRELASLKQEKDDIKLRLDKQIHREKQMPTKAGPSRVSDNGRYESLNHDINLLREDKKNLASQLQKQQTKNKNLNNEKEHSKKLLEESQEILKELNEKVYSLSQELEVCLESKDLLQYQFDQSIIHLKEARQELDEKMKQLEEANNQLEDKSKQFNVLKERINQPAPLSISQRNTTRPNSSNRNMPNKNKNEKSLNTTMEFNSEREGTKPGELDLSLTSQRQTNRSISKESSSRQTKKSECSGVVTNLIKKTLKEKELQEKVNNLEEMCKGLKTKNDSLKTENANLTAKIVIKDNNNSDLKQKFEKLKEQTKSTFSSFDHDSSMTDEIKYLRKLAQTNEKDLKKADLEIKKLTAVKKELEIVLKDSREETQILKSAYTTRGNETSDLDSTYIKGQDFDSKAILHTLNKEMERDEQETQIKLTTENECNKMSKDSKMLVLLEEGEIEHLQKENYDLRMELLSKDTKLQDLMKLSTNSLKVVTEEFMKMASNKFINIHEKVFKLLNRWSNFENYAQKEILKHVNLFNKANSKEEEKNRLEEKGNTRSALSDRPLRRGNTPSKNKALNSKVDSGSRPRSAEEKMKKVSSRLYHSEKKAIQPPSKETNSLNHRTRLSDKKKLSKSTDEFEKDIRSTDLYEEDLSLHQILEEVRYLKKFFTFDDENGPIGPGPKPNPQEQQKVFELLSNALSPKDYMNPGLEDIKETEHETDTLQDEISSSASLK